MITWRKITAEGAGKLIVAYLREHQLRDKQSERAEQQGPDINSGIESGARMNTYYTGRDGKGAWAPQMGGRIAGALGIDPARVPTDEGLARLFEGKRADTGEKWAGTHANRTLSAIDFTASPDKSVTLAAEFASTKAEQAMIWLAIHKANDRAMDFIAREIGVARRGRGGQSHAEEGEVAWVSFRHYAARPAMRIQDGSDGATGLVEIPVPGDPQAHIHNLMFNAVATESGHLGSLDMARITRATSFMFGAYFQAELATELRALGIQVGTNESGRAIVIGSIPKEEFKTAAVIDKDIFRTHAAHGLIAAGIKRRARKSERRIIVRNPGPSDLEPDNGSERGNGVSSDRGR